MKTLFFWAACGLWCATASQSAGQTFSLDGTWDFTVDSSGTWEADSVAQGANWRDARVPLSWQAQFEDLRDYQGVAWYRKSIIIPEIKNDKTLVLHFGAVDYVTEVFVNGRHVGSHEGGYTPFEFDITGLVRQGENELLIRVMDPVLNGNGTEGIRYQNIPHGKQSWYVQTSGIWQSVTLTMRPLTSLKSVRITALADGTFKAGIALNAPVNMRKGVPLNILIRDPEGKIVFHRALSVGAGRIEAECAGRLRSPLLWSPSSPHLYTATFGLGQNAPEEYRFGFRSIEAKDGYLLLNGAPFYMIGALDQDFFPETMYTPPSTSIVRDEMTKAKQIGLNTLRCHIKVPDPVYLKAADEAGVLVWYEIPNWDQLNAQAGERAMHTLSEMLQRDWNHPSLVLISLINESWGIDLRDSVQRAWLKRSFNTAKTMARGRLIVDNSACWGNFHIKTDINDYHTYWAIPENSQRFDETIKDFSRRPSWLFSPFGDAEETGDEPLVLSEFGNWGLPHVPERPPWWINRKFDNVIVAHPQDYLKRMREYRYDGVFGTYDTLAQYSEIAQFEALKHEIETIRLSPQLQGYIITEFTDINWESNGLLDMWRKKKFSAQHLPAIQRQDVVIPRPGRLSAWAGETVEIPVWLSHYSAREIEGSILAWTTSPGGETGRSAPLPRIPRGTVRLIGKVGFSTSNIPPGTLSRVTFRIIQPGGEVIAKNFCSVFAGPSVPHRSGGSSTVVYDPQGLVRSSRPQFPFSGVGSLSTDSSRTVLTSVLDSTMVGYLESGGTVVCWADTQTRLPVGFPLSFARRDTGWLEGNWASNLNWVRKTLKNSGKSPVWDMFARGLVDSSSFSGLVMRGIPPAYSDDVLAGMFVGWVHLNSAYVVQVRVGKGKLLLTTIPRGGSIGRDPIATALFESLVDFTHSHEFQPQFGWIPQ
jgi:hypothetical protein